MPLDNPEQRYAEIVRALGARSGVTHESTQAGGKGFGSTGQLKLHNRIFAMLVRNDLVVKLPRARVDALVQAREGARFEPRRDGRLMKEWLVIPMSSKISWSALAREALDFAVSEGKPSRSDRR